MAQTLGTIATAWDQFVHEAVAASTTPDDQLPRFDTMEQPNNRPYTRSLR